MSAISGPGGDDGRRCGRGTFRADATLTSRTDLSPTTCAPLRNAINADARGSCGQLQRILGSHGTERHFQVILRQGLGPAFTRRLNGYRRPSLR
jgi:hypothetical protein